MSHQIKSSNRDALSRRKTGKVRPVRRTAGEVIETVSKDALPDCPVATAVQLIGNKWRLLIIQHLLIRPWRFNEMHRALEGISQKVLTENLRAMVADGIVKRQAYPEVPPRVEYSLTELGESIRPILHALETWGEIYRAARERDEPIR